LSLLGLRFVLSGGGLRFVLSDGLVCGGLALRRVGSVLGSPRLFKTHFVLVFFLFVLANLLARFRSESWQRIGFLLAH
jgi:hypothetical protein